MFTGLVEAKGVAQGMKRQKKTWILEIKAPRVSKSLRIGSSLAVNGVCLTVVSKKAGSRIFFNLVAETRKRSNLGNLRPGDPVNLERPLKLGGRFEGHLVLGHVDGVGQVKRILMKAREKSFLIHFPKPLGRYFVEKGSVAVDGVSMTLGKVAGNRFWIHGIPHTLTHTLFNHYRVNAKVNLEVDLLAKLAVRTFSSLD